MNGFESGVLGESAMINYTEKIPNNVDLGRDRVLQRALEH